MNMTCISPVKYLFSDQFEENLKFIKSNFECVSKTITQLETYVLEMSEALALIDKLTRTIEVESTPITEKVKNKLKSVLFKNEGYSVMNNLSTALTNPTTLSSSSLPDRNNLRYFRFLPVTSCDVERSFSMYKCLNDGSRRFSFKTLSMYVVCHCNAIINTAQDET